MKDITKKREELERKMNMLSVLETVLFKVEDLRNWECCDGNCLKDEDGNYIFTEPKDWKKDTYDCYNSIIEHLEKLI